MKTTFINKSFLICIILQVFASWLVRGHDKFQHTSSHNLLRLEPMNHELEQGSRIVCDWSDMTNEFDVVPDNNTDDHETEGSEKK